MLDIDDKLKDHIKQSFLNRGNAGSHVTYLRSLKDRGFEPTVIYDIGACVLEWTQSVKELWPNAHYVVFDAFEPFEFLYKENNLDYHLGVLSDSDGRVVRFYQNDYNRTGNSYYREIGGNNDFFPEDRFILRHTRSLDSVVKERGFPLPDLIKIDVQGAEIDILRGAQNVLSNAKHMVIELQHTEYNEGAPKAQESVPIIEGMGWKCVAPLFHNNGPDGDYGFEKV